MIIYETIKDLPIGSTYVNQHMIGLDGRPIRWSIVEIGNADQPTPSVTLQSQNAYWSKPFNYQYWDGSDLRKWLNGTNTGDFLSKFDASAIAQILPHTTIVYTDPAGPNPTHFYDTDKVRVEQLGRANNSYFFSDIPTFYAHATIDIRDTTTVYYSNGDYIDTTGLPMPVITTYFPNDNIGAISAPENIDYCVSNPNNTTDYTIEFYCKKNNTLIAKFDKQTFGTVHRWQMQESQYSIVSNAYQSSIIIKVTDGLGVISTKELTYTATIARYAFPDSASTYLGTFSNHKFLSNYVITIGDNNFNYLNETLQYSHLYLDNVLLKSEQKTFEQVKTNPTQTISNQTFYMSTYNMSIDDYKTQFDSLAPGLHYVKLEMGNVTASFRYVYFTKSSSSITLTTPDLSMKFKDPLSLPYKVSDTNITTNINMVFKVDGTQIGTATVAQNIYYTYTMPTANWNALSRAEHTFEIVATDATDSNLTTSKSFKFIKTDTMILVTSKPLKTLSMAKTICVNMNITTDAMYQTDVYACNNANDTTPTWELMTPEYMSKLTYHFTNTTKTATDWATAVKIYVYKDISQPKLALNGFGYYIGL
jgi:hypothetical protein